MALKSGRVGIHPSQVDPITGMLINTPSGSSSLEDLEDVEITDPEAGQQLAYDGEKWINEFSSISPTTLATLRDVEITDPTDGDYLVYDGTEEKWVNQGEPPAPTTLQVTVTVYSAVGDTIAYTDINGTPKTIPLDNNSDHATHTFEIMPSGSSFTLTSSVAKNPNDLAQDYSKQVTITSGTNTVYVCPDTTLYWYGYNPDLIDTTHGAGTAIPSFETHYIDVNSVAGTSSRTFANSDNKYTGTVKCIAKGVSMSGYAFYGLVLTNDNQVYGGASATVDITSTNEAVYQIANVSDKYIGLLGQSTNSNGQRMYVYAVWVE